MNRSLQLWLAFGWIGFALLPWYVADRGFWSFGWLGSGAPFSSDAGSALFLGLLHEPTWLLFLAVPLLAPLAVLGRERSDPVFARTLILSGAVGFAYVFLQGFTIGIDGWEFPGLEALFGPTDLRQAGMGYGAILAAATFLFLLTTGIAAKGAINGDRFVVGSIGLIVAAVAIFIFFPVFRILISALQDNDGAFAVRVFFEKLFDRRIWGVGCLGGGVRCGVAWNSFLLAVLTGLSSTILGLVFAVIATRTRFRAKRLLRVLTMLPIITPPFVIGLAIILLFGRAGLVSQFLWDVIGLRPTRWIFGLPGIWFAQTLAFTPIAFLVLIGVVEGVSPSMEEAAQTLRAGRWRTLSSISFPLIRPGLANAFLLGFIESLADFGNPLVLGGNYDVMSTEIFFAIVGAQNDQGRAAVLAIVLLFFTLSAFLAQRLWLGRKSYTTVTGKGDSGRPLRLPPALTAGLYGVALPWAALTVVIYVIIMFGGFVELLGRNNSLTLRHFIDTFGITRGQFGLVFSGLAWNSFFTTIWIAAVSAPLTAGIGLLTAYILVRQRFFGKGVFEFGTMLSFAIPGTVIGVSYVLAFNVPPIELTGTGVILIISFVFRNMPVGVRAGMASMSQIDKSLDEASLTLGANSFTTVRKVILPLLRPAIFAALVFSFVRAMTALSAVIFLVSAKYDMATSFIIGRVENGDFGQAIAYSAVLILVMMVVILLLQVAVGRRQIHRREDVQGNALEGLAG
ncbi:MAG: iron ABC transporter permease [Proteobacteria bacterium]|nr:iron ABC transporter permease [Pseudomonadota bacterium]